MSRAREQAARWFSRMQNSDASHPQRAEFDAWLAASPEHRSEYQAFCELWGDFSSIPRSQALADALEQRRALKRRSVLRGGIGLFLLLGLGGYGLHSYRHGAFELPLQTRIGESLRHRLRDGSQVFLNADSRLQVMYGKVQRQILLLHGEAAFDVARDRQRPFIVDAGLAQVRVLGTHFVVSRLPERLRISVERGLVEVTSPRQSLQLRAGQVVEVAADGRLRRLAIAADNAFAFQNGRLVFEQADLAEIAAALSRHRQQPVRALPGGPRIDAVVQLDDIESFLQALPSIAAIRLTQDGESLLLGPAD
ncbi:iron dicitrate transport regulator FecR [Stutzerimonas kirkiae]|uniref:Iron dicitrate transport regulator FecR n=1 Tax=Stutzerimonas kirkiae TaxID=2211392 RepID=A0A4Q9QXW0_9GAMM|nr:FecR domain-containing protein [Stutzerimonas kirkiae]TBU89801.1 iron dicitrate transport regulator FecR [Stutzerimonas kirkiae]TBU99637.1 iron dicitrate transport regulator FecR [Stutzerimonas kirkiae]